MSAEVPQTPTPKSKIEALKRLQSTIETLQELATALEAQPEMTVSDSETKALAILAEGLQPVAIVPSPPPAAKVATTTPERPIAEVAGKAPATPSPTPSPEPLPTAVVPQPEPKPSFIQQIFDRISLKFSLIAFVVGVTFIAILIKLLVFPFPKFAPPSAISPTETIAPTTEVIPLSPPKDTPEVTIPTPTEKTSEVPVNEETPQIVVIPSSTSTNDETPQTVVIPSSTSADEETPQIVVIPSSNSADEETPQIVVSSPNPITEETPSEVSPPEETPQVVTIVPEPADEVNREEETSLAAEIPVAVDIPALPTKPNIPPETTPIAEPKAGESVPAVPAKPTPEQRFIAAIQKQVTQTAQKYVADPSIDSLNANFEGSLLQIRVADRWFGLGSQKQDQLAQSWLQQAQEFDFQTLEIVDGQGTLVARSPVVGSQMIILKR